MIGRGLRQISKALKLVQGEAAGNGDEVIHEVRKRIKKARALVQLSRGAVGRKAREKVDRRLREAARPLSALRDASVLIATLESVVEGPRDQDLSDALAEARAALEAHRDRVADWQFEGDRALSRVSKALRETRRRLGRWDALGDADPVEAFKRTYRRGRAAYKEASVDPSPSRLHELRKRVKELGYQLATVEADPSGPIGRLERLADLLGDELGEVHDLDVLREFLVDLEKSGPILEKLERRRLGLRHSSLQRARVVFFDRPRAFAKLLEAAPERVEAASAEG